MSLRMQKVNSQMQRAVAQIIREEIDDPAVGFLSITRVDTAADLSESRIYFSVLNEARREKVQAILGKMAKLIRFNLSKKIRLKRTPDLKFFHDDSIRYSVDIYNKIEDARASDRSARTAEEKGEGGV